MKFASDDSSSAWIRGFCTALADLYRHDPGVGAKSLVRAAREAGVSLTAAKAAGVPRDGPPHSTQRWSCLVTDRVFEPGEHAEAQEEMRKQNSRVLFDGRTLLVECVFRTIVDPNVLASRLRQACAGPQLRMIIGGLERRGRDAAFLTKSFINTDETIMEIGARLAGMSPKPERVEISLVARRDADKIWAEVHRMQDGGD